MAWTLGLYLSLLLAGCIQDIILRPSLADVGKPEDFGFTNYEEKMLPTPKEQQVSIFHIHSDQSKLLLVVVPGSDANKSFYTFALPYFVPYGVDMILMDYIGYGDSPGRKSFENLIDSTQGVIEYAVAQHQYVFALGESIGTPTLIRVAADHPELSGVLLEGSVDPRYMPWAEAHSLFDGYISDPIVSVLELPFAAYAVAGTPTDMYSRDWIKKVTPPKFFIHSYQDEVTPYIGMMQIYEDAPDPKELWTVWGHHCQIAKLIPDEYSAKLRGWMDSVIQNSNTGEVQNEQ